MYTPHLNNGRFGAVIKAPTLSIPEADPVFSVGDTVMHPSEGVCTITELRRMEMGGTPRTYYVLKPSADQSSSTVYLPVARGNETLRALLSREDILALIRLSREYEGLWIADSKQRKEAFTHILSEGNYAKMIRMIVELHEQGALREREGKKPCAADSAILTEAERLLHQEFSYVLHMSLEETIAFVRQALKTE